MASGDDSDEDSNCHRDQNDSEHRIELSDYLVDGQKGGQNIIDQYHDDPEVHAHPFRCELSNKGGRTVDEYGTGQKEQKDREESHSPFGAFAQIDSRKLCNREAVMALRNHAHHVVVDRTAEDGTEDYPQEHDRSETGTHQGSEDRARTCDVQKLDQICFPGLHRDIVHSVLQAIGRSLSLIRGEDLLHKSSVDEIACNQYGKGSQKRYHGTTLRLQYTNHRPAVLPKIKVLSAVILIQHAQYIVGASAEDDADSRSDGLGCKVDFRFRGDGGHLLTEEDGCLHGFAEFKVQHGAHPVSSAGFGSQEIEDYRVLLGSDGRLNRGILGEGLDLFGCEAPCAVNLCSGQESHCNVCPDRACGKSCHECYVVD